MARTDALGHPSLAGLTRLSATPVGTSPPAKAPPVAWMVTNTVMRRAALATARAAWKARTCMSTHLSGVRTVPSAARLMTAPASSGTSSTALALMPWVTSTRSRASAKAGSHG